MGNLKELRNTNKLYETVIDEILEDSKFYKGTKKEKIITRCNEIIEYGCASRTVKSLIYYADIMRFYDNFYYEIQELIEELINNRIDVVECLKRNVNEVSIIMNDDVSKKYVSWLTYEEIAYKLLNEMER